MTGTGRTDVGPMSLITVVLHYISAQRELFWPHRAAYSALSSCESNTGMVQPSSYLISVLHVEYITHNAPHSLIHLHSQFTTQAFNILTPLQTSHIKITP